MKISYIINTYRGSIMGEYLRVIASLLTLQGVGFSLPIGKPRIHLQGLVSLWIHPLPSTLANISHNYSRQCAFPKF